MKKRDTIRKYIDKQQELDLLSSLEQRGLDAYDEYYKALLEILIIMLDETSKNQLPIQQLLFKNIYAVLDKILCSPETIVKFTEIIKSNIERDNNNVTSFVSRFILNIKDNIENIGYKPNIEYLEQSLRQININVLKKFIHDKKEHVSIIDAFYNCVEDLESNRRVILAPKAIEIFKAYIEDNPKGYLSHFIRPYYIMFNKKVVDYFLHVVEPFCLQIFPGENSFLQYLDKIRAGSAGNDIDLVDDIIEFSKKALSNGSDESKPVVLFSPQLESTLDGKRSSSVKLKSSKHIGVRSDCKPPLYKSEDV